METFISARSVLWFLRDNAESSSPVFEYSPCRACEGGWSYTNTSTNWSSKATSSIALNVTGTGISFDITHSSTWTTDLTVNGTSYNSTDQPNLPWGRHAIILDFAPAKNATTSDEVIFTGATVQLGTLSGASSINATVDDSNWRDWKVLLSPGWNMMEKGESNWINTVC